MKDERERMVRPFVKIALKQYRELWDECHRRFCAIDLDERARQHHTGLLSQSYFQQFSHYPSGIISRGTQLALAPNQFGLTISSTLITDARLPSEMTFAFPGGVFEHLKQQLMNWPVTFGELVEVAARATGHAEDIIARQIMWLIKYGMVVPVDAVPNTHSVIQDASMTAL